MREIGLVDAMHQSGDRLHLPTVHGAPQRCNDLARTLAGRTCSIESMRQAHEMTAFMSIGARGQRPPERIRVAGNWGYPRKRSGTPGALI